MPELLWAGKYDEHHQIIGPPRVSLPFQTIETVNQSAQERQTALAARHAGHAPQWRNRLIWGDKKYVLPSLLAEFAGKVDLIYIDPPFATGANFGYQAQVHPDNGNGKAQLKLDYQPNLIEEIAYRDTWGGGLDTYLKWMFETLTFLRELLAESGSIYVHCDDTASHYIKAVMDGVFGDMNFQNDLIWRRAISHNDSRRYGRILDSILFYTKSGEWVWNGDAIADPKSPEELLAAYPSSDDRGNYRADNMTGAGASSGESGKPWKSYDVTSRNRHWAPPMTGRYAEFIERQFIPGYRNIQGVHDRLDALDACGLIHHPRNGVWPGLKRYADSDAGNSPQTLILEPRGFTNFSAGRGEYSNYPTQKPEALLERIIKASSNPGDLVLDCFVGSGTTAAVAEKLGRRWIAADLGRFAISTTRKRLLAIPDVQPFQVQNLGRYERQAWQQVGLELDCQRFILELYHATPLTGYQWLHGSKAGRMVHIGAVDAPVSLDDVQKVVAEFRAIVGSGADAPTTNGVDILGWDFALEADTEAKELAHREGINIRLRRIPREVMDPRAVAAGDVRFFELASLSIDRQADQAQHGVTLTLDSFIMPPEGIPDQVREKVTHWSQWIDYWAVD